MRQFLPCTLTSRYPCQRSLKLLNFRTVYWYNTYMAQQQQPHTEVEPVRIKQRVIGAIVLVSLGVIFIPMLLNSERSLDDGMPVFGSNIPNKPAYISKKADKSTTPSSAAIIIKSQADFDSRVMVDEHTPKLKDESVASFAKEESPTKIIPAKDSSQKSSKAAQTQEAKKKSTPNQTTAKKLTTSSEIITAKTAPTAKQPAKAWAIQVGSFSERKNAFSLRNKLRSKRFTAFVDAIKTPKGNIYRVRVGPEVQRVQAEKTQQRLFKELKISGLVIAHP